MLQRCDLKGSVWELNNTVSTGIKFDVLQTKSTYLVALLYYLLFARVSSRFEAFSASSRLLVVFRYFNRNVDGRQCY